jgi:hypothetical protein
MSFGFGNVIILNLLRQKYLVLKKNAHLLQFRHMSGKKIPLADGLGRNTTTRISLELNNGK